MQRLCVGLLGLALSTVAVGLHATNPGGSTPDAGAGDTATRVRLLGTSAEPDAWLLGAWTARFWCKEACDPVQADLLFERVLAQPPRDPTVLRLLIGQLPTFLAGDPARLAAERSRLTARVQALDPDSLSSWLTALPDPADARRRDHGTEILARAAQATRVGADYLESYRWIVGRLAELPADPGWQADPGTEADPDKLRRTVAIAVVHAIATPSSQPLTRWCREPLSPWADDCRTIARLLANGETLHARMLGRHMLDRLARTDAERKEAARAAAQTEWLRAAQTQCDVLDDSAILATMEQDGVTEIGLIEAQLQARGLPLEAPADPELRRDPCGPIGARAERRPKSTGSSAG